MNNNRSNNNGSTNVTETTSSTSIFSFDRHVKPVLYFIVVLFASGCLALILGEELERQAWEKVPSTLPLYTTDEVCHDKDSDLILNCGHCGHCSNLQDILIYHQTRHTLTDIMTQCAIQDLLWGDDAHSCLIERSGLSANCSSCWVLNYHCNVDNCMRTCFKHRKLPFLPSLRSWDTDRLDPCFACDEKHCGPIFVECAGANRRRAGVISDIERDMELEMCTKVDWDTILAKSMQDQSNEQQNPKVATTSSHEEGEL